jgi:hypothetical protein
MRGTSRFLISGVAVNKLKPRQTLILTSKPQTYIIRSYFLASLDGDLVEPRRLK